MIIVRVKYGLGNQMFQYAFGRVLSLKYSRDLYFDLEYFIHPYEDYPRVLNLPIFNLSLPVLEDDQIKAISKLNVIEETDWSYCEEIHDCLEAYREPLFFTGYWQSWKYFTGFEDVIKQDFSFVAPLTGKWLALSETIVSTTSVLIHIRRGDYLEPQNQLGVLPVEYIYEAITLMKEKVRSPVFYIFSDDICWCKQNLRIGCPSYFIDNEYCDPLLSHYFQLMVNCRHFIIANSTFSWWAAWLGGCPDKIVIAPRHWYQKIDPVLDIHPPGWIRL